MKQRLSLLLFLLCCLSAQNTQAAGQLAKAIEVTVENPEVLDRKKEMIEIPWAQIVSRISVKANELIVQDENGVQVCSQLIYAGGGAPRSIIFQVEMPPRSKAVFTLCHGKRKIFPSKTFGRYVPERSDDYAWENNLIAYRVYGPALRSPKCPGMDVWVKATEALVINRWYAAGDYHKNKGEGMDCYNVGSSLGVGASAPMYQGTLAFSGNYVRWKTLDVGPLRTSVLLSYGPYPVGNDTVWSEKIISLDADSYLNHVTEVYRGNFKQLKIGVGVITHQLRSMNIQNGMIAIAELASDTPDPERDGLIYVGMLTRSGMPIDFGSHRLFERNLHPNESFSYDCGAAWDKREFREFSAWRDYLNLERQKKAHPLSITFRAI